MAHPRLTPRVQRRAALAASGWVALAATAFPGGSPLRWIPVLAFVALAPGLALLLPQPLGLRPGPAWRPWRSPRPSASPWPPWWRPPCS